MRLDKEMMEFAGQSPDPLQNYPPSEGVIRSRWGF